VRVLSIGSMYPPHDLRGGYELTWRASVRQLRSHGHEVRVLASDYRSPDLPRDEELDGDVHRELRWYWRDHEFPRHSWRERMELERHNAGVLERQLSGFGPDVVAWWQMGGMSIALVERVRRAGLPAVGVIGDEWLRWGPRADAWLKPFQGRPRLAALAERLTGLPARVDVDGAATWLFNSEVVRRKTSHEGLALSHGEVLHPGIDDSLFKPAEPREWRWRLLYLGRLDSRKGIHLAIEALALLPDAATLVIQGSGGDDSYVRRLHDRADELGVLERVRFSTEPRERLPDVYGDTDVLVFPVQWDEPWGLVPLEAMAVGRPVVATGTGGSREYLQHERNCLVYEPLGSAQALAASIRRLGDDPGLRDRLRTEGFATAARYTETAYNEAIECALEAARSWRENL
jgi:glycosyltransferase involved in cell wall biosynthesis